MTTNAGVDTERRNSNTVVEMEMSTATLGITLAVNTKLSMDLPYELVIPLLVMQSKQGLYFLPCSLPLC